MKNRRFASRYRASVKVVCSGERRECMAEIRDLSSSGALVLGLEWTPAPASLLTLTLEVAPEHELTGRVARFASDGVAIRFESLESAAKSMLDDLARM